MSDLEAVLVLANTELKWTWSWQVLRWRMTESTVERKISWKASGAALAPG
jgi:hypothetical protein